MAHHHSPKSVSTGLVLALDAANRKSYPGSGNVWYDMSGYGNHVTWQQAPTGGTNGNSTIDWDGTNKLGGFTWTPTNDDTDYSFRTDVSTGLPTGDPNYSIEIVMKILNGNNNWHIFTYGQQSFSQNNGIYLQNTNNSLNKFFYGNDYYQITNFSSVVGYNTLFHYTETYDPVSSTLKCYINGAQHNSQTVGTNPNITLYNTGRLNIGGGVITATRTNHAGDMHICKLYNITLSADQVAQNFEAVRSRFGL